MSSVASHESHDFGLLHAQMFNQDPDRPAVLYNHDNEYLHYQDDWYIIASKPDSYAVVYYKGSNDAWDGYGGAVVYTRERQLPQVHLLPGHMHLTVV